MSKKSDGNNRIVAIVHEYRISDIQLETGGFGYYPINLRRALKKRDDCYSELIQAGDSLISELSKRRQESLLRVKRRITYEFFQKRRRVRYLQRRIEEIDKSKNWIIYHKMNPFTLPSLEIDKLLGMFNVVIVTTAVDFLEDEYPELFEKKEIANRRRAYEVNYGAASAIISISDFVGRKVANLYQTDSRDVFCAPLGSDHFSEQSSAEIIYTFNGEFSVLTNPYVLFPAKDWKHKGHREILGLIKQGLWPKGLKLVLVGDISKSNTIRNTALQLSDVVLLGRVTEDDLKYLYTNCFAVLMPSIYEGFGLPYLEAGTFNKPVVAFRNEASLELFSNDYPLVPLGDYMGLVDQIEKMISSDEFYRELQEKSSRAAKRYTWEGTANKTIEAYELAISKINEYLLNLNGSDNHRESK